MSFDFEALISKQFQVDGPGVAIAVVKDGKCLYQLCYGQANLEWHTPIQPDTVFRLASVTKQFTATAILMLQKQGKLHVNDPLTKFLPAYPTSGHDIRLHHLLTHTSGIKSYTAIDNWFPNEIMKDMTPEAVCDVFSQIPFDFKPGTQYLYNNSGYHLLGMIIEQVAEMPYATFIETHIFKPLQMTNACYLSNELIIKNRAAGYETSEDGFCNAPYLSMTQPYAAGSLGATLDDLVRWDIALQTHQLVTKETLEQMWTPVVLNDGTIERYGYGWGIGHYRGHRMVYHAGGINGFSTFMVHLPDDKTGIYLLSNFANFDTTDTMLNILRLALDMPPITHQPVSLPPAKLKRLSGNYHIPHNGSIDVIYENDLLQITDYPGQHLLALDETHFYLSNQTETDIIFTLSDSGKGVSVKLESPLMSYTGIQSE